MTTSRESFSTLENGTGDGVALRQIQQGDTVAAKNGLLAFGFVDSAGNAVAPMLTPQGAFYVDNSSAGTDKFARGAAVPTAAGIAGAVTVVSMAMTNNKTYTELNVQVACRRDAFFQLVYDNGTTQAVLCDFILGPGQYTASFDSLHFTQTAGATGSNLLKVVGYCFDKATDMFSTLSCVESV